MKKRDEETIEHCIFKLRVMLHGNTLGEEDTHVCKDLKRQLEALIASSRRERELRRKRQEEKR